MASAVLVPVLAHALPCPMPCPPLSAPPCLPKSNIKSIITQSGAAHQPSFFACWELSDNLGVMPRVSVSLLRHCWQ